MLAWATAKFFGASGHAAVYRRFCAGESAADHLRGRSRLRPRPPSERPVREYEDSSDAEPLLTCFAVERWTPNPRP